MKKLLVLLSVLFAFEATGATIGTQIFSFGGGSGSGLRSDCGAGEVMKDVLGNNVWSCEADDGGAGSTTIAGMTDTDITAPQVGEGMYWNGTTDWVDGPLNLSTAGATTGTLAGAKITTGSITATQLGTDSVDTDEIVAGAVTTTEILDDTIGQLDLASNSVGPSEIQNGAVGISEVTAAIATNAEVTAEIGVHAALAGAHHTATVDTSAETECTGTESLRGDGTCVSPTGGSSHAMLSSTHTDSLAAAVSQGSVMVGNSTPAWSELVLGPVSSVFMSDGSDAFWDDTPAFGVITASTMETASIQDSAGTPLWSIDTDGAADFASVTYADVDGSNAFIHDDNSTTTSISPTGNQVAVFTKEDGEYYKKDATDQAGGHRFLTAQASGGGSLPDCDNATDDKILYDSTTGLISCGVDQGAGAVDFSSLTNGTNVQAAMVVSTGASLAAGGSGTIAATTADALAVNPNNCSAGNAPRGVAANGNAEDCTAYQASNAHLDDLADGTLTGSKVGTGISGTNVSTGTVADARIASTIARDSELHTAVTVSGTPDYVTLSGQDLVRGTVDVGDDTNLAAGRSLTLTGDSVAADEETYRDEMPVVVQAGNMTAGDEILQKATGALTLSQLDCVAIGGTTSNVVVNVVECTNAGGTCATSGYTATVNSNGTNFSDATGTDSAIDDADWWGIELTTITAEANYLYCTVEYTRND